MLQSWFGEKSADNQNQVERSPDAQSKVDDATRKLALYHYESCWFCRSVRNTIEHLKLDIELRDIHRVAEQRQRLITEGGSGTVPCLCIEHDDGRVEWLYESRDIIAYLVSRFGADIPS